MEFNLIIFEGTDLIKFGMTSEEIQSILKVKPRLFKKNPSDLYFTEAYKGICRVYYDNSQKCAALEFVKPSQVFFSGIQLLGEQRNKIESVLKDKFDDFREDVGSLLSDKYEIGVYAPILPDSQVVESVYIARKGYRHEQH